MAENKLGLLFTQIASSIRGGLGDIGKMSPFDFPDKVTEIVNLIGSGGESEGTGSSGDLTFASGSFKTDDNPTRMTIEHGLGVMPDLVLVYNASMYPGSVEEYASEYPAPFIWGMKSTFDTAVRGCVAWAGSSWTTAHGIDNMDSSDITTGHIYCPDEATFSVGRLATNNNGHFSTNTTYRWLAISGIGGESSVIAPLEITENGTYTAPEGVDGYNPVTVNVEPVLQEKTITENGEYTPDEGFDGLSKVTVEVAGAGGGSLPAGVYWEQFLPAIQYAYGKTYFVHDGSLCVYCMEGSSTSNGRIYKLVDGAWELKASATDCYASANGYAIEYNGKVHFFNGAYHNEWDGASAITKKASLPASCDNMGQFVLDGKLYSWSYSIKKPLVWNESADTWSAASDFTALSAVDRSSIYQNGEDVYLFYVSSLYKLQVDKTWAKVATISSFSPSIARPLFRDGYMYYIFYNTYGKPGTLLRLNLDTYTNEIICNVPFSGYGAIYEHNGEVRVYPYNQEPTTAHVIMHEVTE